MLAAHLAHIIAPLPDVGAWISAPLAVAVIVAGIALWVEHQIVSGGVAALRAAARVGAALLCLFAVTATGLPSADAQTEGQIFPGLPDLISDPMIIWFQRDVESPLDGPGLRRVVTFEGSIHNIGEGSLDLLGNPQIPGGVKQRVFDGDTWTDVGSPTVEYETSDDHNHFHVMGLVHYSLWDAGQTELLDDGSKVGFCLTDVEEWPDAPPKLYSYEFASGFCGQFQPDLTDLRMGISPRWSDVYGPNITLQWIDITDVAPGRYWVGAVTDPNDEIVESDETNNSTIFSRDSFLVRGWRALPIDDVAVSDSDVAITLSAVAIGTVGKPAFVIVEGPEHGELDVPVGTDMFDPTVTYRPSPGFSGTDSFSYYAHDAATPFPKVPVIETVQLVVAARPDAPPVGARDLVDLQIVGPEAAQAITYQDVSVAVTATSAQPDTGVDVNVDIEWFASGLPHGLAIDQSTGEIAGQPTIEGEYVSTIVARPAGSFGSRDAAELDIAWSVNEPDDAPVLLATHDLSTATDEDVRVNFGPGVPGSTYRAEGLPPGMTVNTNVPLVVGTPTKIGSYDVTIAEVVDGAAVHQTSFVWTIRPAAVPGFPL